MPRMATASESETPRLGKRRCPLSVAQRTAGPCAALARRGMLVMQGQPHMPLGRRDRSMRDARAPGLPWLSRPGTKLLFCVMVYAIL
jgi:hypothetical protein